MSNRTEITKELKAIVSNVTRIDLSDLSENTRVREELGIDSLMAMEIVALCEKQFGISIDEEQLFQVETVGDFYNLVVKATAWRQMYEKLGTGRQQPRSRIQEGEHSKSDTGYEDCHRSSEYRFSSVQRSRLLRLPTTLLRIFSYTNSGDRYMYDRLRTDAHPIG